jgi:hypothetical protein
LNDGELDEEGNEADIEDVDKNNDDDDDDDDGKKSNISNISLNSERRNTITSMTSPYDTNKENLRPPNEVTDGDNELNIIKESNENHEVVELNEEGESSHHEIEEDDDILAPRKRQKVINPVVARKKKIQDYYFQGWPLL